MSIQPTINNYLKCKKTFEESYTALQVLDHATFYRFRLILSDTPHVYLSFDGGQLVSLITIHGGALFFDVKVNSLADSRERF